ncbi:MAG: hypothetical protein E7178_04320 [Erysipelotrichaceae bacterium]|nr:hypothetical protein [Erysipelotrichaceae bacterium]
MNINLIRLINKNDELLKGEDDLLLEDLSEQLLEEDISLVEGVIDSPVDVILVESDDVFEELKKHLKKLNKYIYLFTFCKGRSYAEALSIYNYLGKNGYHVLLDDDPLNALKGILPTYIDISRVKKSINGKTFGMFIPNEESSYEPKFDFGKMNKTFGISVIKIGKEELFKEFRKNKIGNPPHLLKLKKMAKNSKALNKSLYLYNAIKVFVDKYHLVGFTLDQKVIINELGVSPNLALSLFNEEGILAVSRNDLSSLLTSYLAYLMNSRIPFIVEPINSNYEEKILSLKCDYPPLNQVKSYEIANPHDQILEINCEINLGEASLLKIGSDVTHFYAIGAEIKQGKDNLIALYIDEIPLFSFIRDAAERQLVLVSQDISVQYSALLNYLDINK